MLDGQTTRSCHIAQGTIFNILSVCLSVCVTVTLLYRRNKHNIVNQLYFNKIFLINKKNCKKFITIVWGRRGDDLDQGWSRMSGEKGKDLRSGGSNMGI